MVNWQLFLNLYIIQIMRKILFIVCFFTIAGAGQVLGQRFVLPDQSDSLGTVIKSALYQQRNEAARDLGDHIEAMWYDGTLALDEQKRIHTHLEKMIGKNLKPNPDFRTYFSAISHAKITEGLDNQKFGEFLNVTTKVIDAYDRPIIARFLKTSKTLFEYRALHYDKSNSLLISADNYHFEFEDVAVIEELLPEIEEPIEEEEPEDEVK